MNLSITQPRPGSLVLTAGILLAGALWLSVLVNSNGSVATPHPGLQPDPDVARSVESPVSAAAPMASARIEADVTRDEFFESRSYDCGAVTGGDAGGFMSQWARPSTI
ncbi:MAG TPA: hypothetical protein VIT83_05100 [Gammaproteobacteria bacterium]